MSGAQRKKPAGPQQLSEYDRNITVTWKTFKNENAKADCTTTGLENSLVMLVYSNKWPSCLYIMFVN